MLSYSLKFRKNTESKILKVVKTKIGRLMGLSNCAICSSKKSKFMKEQETRRLLSSLRIRTPWSKIPLNKIQFCWPFSWHKWYKLNEIMNKFLFVGDKFMPKMRSRQPRFTYRAWDLLLKTKN